MTVHHTRRMRGCWMKNKVLANGEIRDEDIMDTITLKYKTHP
jgi:hypothetical protein